MKKDAHTNENPRNSIDEDNSLLTFTDFIGISKTVKDIRQRVSDYSKEPTGRSLLITGERGTGKDKLARIFHNNSAYVRNKTVYIQNDCGNYHSDTIQSTLFGHCVGAFTGANQARKGSFITATGGTLFLDEIGNMQTTMQSKLLRAIEYRKIIPLGGDNEISFDAQLIFATNKDLNRLCKEGVFLDDLLDRLRLRQIHIAPLREHKEDLPVLIAFIVNKLVIKHELNDDVKIDAEVPEKLACHNFPGNVRELDGIINNAFDTMILERTLTLCAKHIVFNEHATQSADNISDINQISMNELLKNHIILVIETNQTLWKDRKLCDVPFLFDLKECNADIKNTVYEAVGRNKALAAKILNVSVHQFNKIH